MKILVSTDTSCLVNYEALKKYEISVFPLNVIIDGEEYLDGVTINQDQLKDAMRGGKNIKTSTPPLGEIIDYFENLFAKGYEKIIHFTISSKLSSMYELFKNVAEQNFKDKLVVVDSYSLSSNMLSHVFYAYDEIAKGTPIEEIASVIENGRNKMGSFVFIPENLTALKNGGRISPTVALIGNTIGIKPVIVLKDGALEKDGIIKNVKRAMIDALDLGLKEFSKEEYDYTIINFDCNEKVAQYVYDYAENLLGGKYIKGVVPINACAHCGPGTIGVVVSPKINGKSLIEFL
ncbi:MAG: DegV family protein [Clostridiales bacterium]|nr:DegV family protein [Clostridiales bacterium]